MGRGKKKRQKKGTVYVGKLVDEVNVYMTQEAINHPSWKLLLECLVNTRKVGKFWQIGETELDSFNEEFIKFLGFYEVKSVGGDILTVDLDHETQAVISEASDKSIQHAVEKQDDEFEPEDLPVLETLRNIDFLAQDRLPLWCFRVPEPIKVDGKDKRALCFVTCGIQTDELDDERIPELLWDAKNKECSVLEKLVGGKVMPSLKKIKVVDAKVVESPCTTKPMNKGGFDIIFTS